MALPQAEWDYGRRIFQDHLLARGCQSVRLALSGVVPGRAYPASARSRVVGLSCVSQNKRAVDRLLDWMADLITAAVSRPRVPATSSRSHTRRSGLQLGAWPSGSPGS